MDCVVLSAVCVAATSRERHGGAAHLAPQRLAVDAWAASPSPLRQDAWPASGNQTNASFASFLTDRRSSGSAAAYPETIRHYHREHLCISRLWRYVCHRVLILILLSLSFCSDAGFALILVVHYPDTVW